MGRSKRGVLAVCILLGLALARAEHPPQARPLHPLQTNTGAWEERALYARIDKVQPRIPPAAVLAEVELLQELQDAWVVRLTEATAARLAQADIAFDTFDPVPDGDVLFLVSSSAPEDVEALRQVGATWPLDSWNSLLVTTDEDVRARVPSHLHLKRLSERLDRTPTFRIAGRAAATARRPAAIRLTAGPAIAEMVGEVSAQALADTIKKLEGFQTRYATQPACGAAGAWLFDAFHAQGLAVERDDFPFSGYTGTNIVATLPGRTSPDQIVIVGAHYDSYSNDATRLAPGADDNASGTAAVLEIARVLSRRSFDFTIKFVAFSAEEFGLYGSRHFAQQARAAGWKIIGVVNLDMVAYVDREPEDLDLIVNGNSEWLAGFFTTTAGTYAPLPTLKVVNASFNRSDHASFWDQNFSALCGIEDSNPTNPNYHRTYDTFSTLNMNFETAVTRASLATVAALAQPYATPQPPSNVTAKAQTLGTVLMRAKSVFVNWTAAPGVTGYNVYRSETARGPYTRLTRTPVTGTTFVDRLRPVDVAYYYVVTSVDAGGNEGNYSAEVAIR